MAARPYDDIDDKTLLARFHAEGDNAWLGILLERYTALLFGVCMKYLKHEEDARDSVQQIFLKVISEMHKYEVEYFKSWLYMVAKNHCLMKLRDKKIYTAELNEQAMTRPDEKLLHAAKEREITLDRMESAMLKLNPEQRKAVEMFYFEKKSYQQIADEENISVMQVKSNIQNGKRNLRIHMSSMFPDGE